MTAQAFFSHPEWADHPIDESGNVIVGRWVQPGEVLFVSSQDEHWRDQYGAYLVAHPEPEVPTAPPEPEPPAEEAPLEPEKPAKKAVKRSKK